MTWFDLWERLSSSAEKYRFELVFFPGTSHVLKQCSSASPRLCGLQPQHQSPCAWREPRVEQVLPVGWTTAGHPQLASTPMHSQPKPQQATVMCVLTEVWLLIGFSHWLHFTYHVEHVCGWGVIWDVCTATTINPWFHVLWLYKCLCRFVDCFRVRFQLRFIFSVTFPTAVPFLNVWRIN